MLNNKTNLFNYAIVDSGTSSHMITPNTPCINKLVSNGLNIRLPNDTFTKSTHTADLDLPFLDKQAKNSHVVPAFKDYSLFSVPQLTKLGYTVIFDERVRIMKNGIEIHNGHFDKNSQLFWIRVTQQSNDRLKIQAAPTQVSSANAYSQNFERCKNKDLANFYHRCLLCPKKSTFLDAIRNNHFIGWPGLNEELIKKYLDPQPITEQGHMHHSSKNVRPTN